MVSRATVFWLSSLLLIGCQRLGAALDHEDEQALIEAEVFSPGHIGRVFLNGRFRVIRSDELIGGYSRSVVILRRIGLPGSILLNLCTPIRLKQDGDYALIGSVQRAKACPGFELINEKESPGAVLSSVENCTTEPNYDPVFSLPARHALLRECEEFSLSSSPREGRGNCPATFGSTMFDTYGLLKCGQKLNSGP